MEFPIKVDFSIDKAETVQKRVQTPLAGTRSPRKVIRLYNNSLNRAVSTSPFQESPAIKFNPERGSQCLKDSFNLKKNFKEPGLSIFHLNNPKIKEKVSRRIESVVYSHIYEEDFNIQGAIDYYRQRLLKKTVNFEEKSELKLDENTLERINRQKIRKKYLKKTEKLAESLEIKNSVRKIKTPQIVLKKVKELIPLTKAKAKVRINRENRPCSKEIKETLKNFRIQFVGK